VNGDEAWFAVRYYDVTHGAAESLATPTGNPSFFYYALLLAGQALLPAGVAALRFPAAASGFCLVLCTYLLLRRVTAMAVAAAAAILMAALPVNLIYARIGWVPCLTVLACLFPVVFAVRLKPLWTAAALLLAYLIHPTTLFLTPVVVMPFVFRWRRQNERSTKHLLAYGGGLALLAAAGGIATYLAQPSLVGPALAKIPDRLDPFNLPADVLVHFVQLFSGTTSFRYVAGSAYGNLALLADLATGAAMFVALAFGSRPLWREGGPKLAAAAGLAVSLAGAVLVAGPEILHPHFERYGLFVVAPTVVVFVFLCESSQTLAGRPWRLLAAASLGGWFLLGIYTVQFHDFFLETGGRNEYAFRTGPNEPKAAAYAVIQRDREPDEPVSVVASSWWNHYPIRYLMASHGNLESGDLIFNLEGGEDTSQKRELAADRVQYVVVFAGDPVDQWLRANLEAKIAHTWPIADYAGADVLYVYRFQAGDWQWPPMETLQQRPGG
jgi:hypothetical protein